MSDPLLLQAALWSMNTCDEAFPLASIWLLSPLLLCAHHLSEREGYIRRLRDSSSRRKPTACVRYSVTVEVQQVYICLFALRIVYSRCHGVDFSALLCVVARVNTLRSEIAKCISFLGREQWKLRWSLALVAHPLQYLVWWEFEDAFLLSMVIKSWLSEVL